MAGPVTRGQFGPLLARDLRKVFYETGKERPLEYTAWANVGTMGWNPVRDQQVAGIGAQPEKPEGQPFALDAHIIGGDKEYLAVPYGMAIEFTWEGWRDELYGVAEEMVAEMSRATRNRQEVQAHAPLNSAFDSTFDGFTTGEALCGAHVGLDGITRRNSPVVSVGLSITGVQDAVFRYETMTTERGMPRLMTPVMALVTPGNKSIAREVLGSTGKPYVADNEYNALLQEDLTWMVDHYITTMTYWFLLAAKGVHDINFLWRDTPIFDNFDDPWTKNAIYTSYQRFANGFGAWRGIDAAPG